MISVFDLIFEQNFLKKNEFVIDSPYWHSDSSDFMECLRQNGERFLNFYTVQHDKMIIYLFSKLNEMFQIYLHCEVNLYILCNYEGKVKLHKLLMVRISHHSAAEVTLQFTKSSRENQLTLASWPHMWSF